MALSAADRTKLVHVLGMLGSDYDGERAAAGLAANRIIKNAGTTWQEVLLEQKQRPARPVPPTGRGNFREEPIYASDMDLCRRHLEHLTPWERDFTRSLGKQRKPPSFALELLRVQVNRHPSTLAPSGYRGGKKTVSWLRYSSKLLFWMTVEGIRT